MIFVKPRRSLVAWRIARFTAYWCWPTYMIFRLRRSLPAPMNSVPMEPSYKPPPQQSYCNCDLALHSHHRTASNLVENRASPHRLSTLGRANNGHHTHLLRSSLLPRYHFFNHSSCLKHQLSLKSSLDNRYSCRFSRNWLLYASRFNPFFLAQGIYCATSFSQFAVDCHLFYQRETRMEALGGAVSVVQLFEFTIKTIKYLYRVKEASNERTGLLREAQTLLTLLLSLQAQVDKAKQSDAWSVGIESLTIKNGPLDQLRDGLENLTDKLKPKKGMKTKVRKFVWTLDKTYCEDLLQKIERAKSSINLALQGDTLYACVAVIGGQPYRLIFECPTVSSHKLSRRTQLE